MNDILVQAFYAIAVIGIAMLITGAVAIPTALYNKKTGCELNRKYSLTNAVLPDVANLEYNICQKKADFALKWSVPVLSIGGVITGICLVLVLVSYLKQRYFN